MRYEHPFGPPEEDEPAFDWLVLGAFVAYAVLYSAAALAIIWASYGLISAAVRVMSA